METLTAVEIQGRLSHFSGTEHHYLHWTKALKYTDGIKEMAELCGAYWFIDVIASAQRLIRGVDYQVWRIVVNPEDKTALIDCWTDTPGESTLLYKQDLEFTAFPLDELEVWVEGGVALLRSEH